MPSWVVVIRVIHVKVPNIAPERRNSVVNGCLPRVDSVPGIMLRTLCRLTQLISPRTP